MCNIKSNACKLQRVGSEWTMKHHTFQRGQYSCVHQSLISKFFHLCPPMSLKTLRTSLNSMFKSSLLSPSGFLDTRAPSSTTMAREETRESNTDRSSAEVGLRVGSFSELNEWIKLRCWYWTYRKITVLSGQLSGGHQRKGNTHFAPFNLFYAFALGAANQRSEQQSFMEAEIPEKCCCRAILHWLYNFSNMGGFDCAPRSLHKLYRSSTGQQRYK